MNELVISIQQDWTDILSKARRLERLIHATNSCWWKIGEPVYYNRVVGLPCGPRGEMLLEIPDSYGFVISARKSVKHYGKWGLGALLIAYHGNVQTENGLPTSLSAWEDYNDLLDMEVKRGGDVTVMLIEAGLPYELINP